VQVFLLLPPSLGSKVPDLILRSRVSGVSKDEWHQRGRMVRDGAIAPPHHEGPVLCGEQNLFTISAMSADSVSFCDGDAIAA
jgi:hypothetical protein